MREPRRSNREGASLIDARRRVTVPGCLPTGQRKSRGG